MTQEQSVLRWIDYAQHTISLYPRASARAADMGYSPSYWLWLTKGLDLEYGTSRAERRHLDQHLYRALAQ